VRPFATPSVPAHRSPTGDGTVTGTVISAKLRQQYVEFDTPSSPLKLALYGRRAAAKDAGVPPDGTGSHRLVIGSDAGPFTDPDGFVWEPAPV